VKFDSGTLNTANSGQATGIQCGSGGDYGGYCLIEACEIKGAGGTGIEIDNFWQAIHRDCTVQDSNQGSYLMNVNGSVYGYLNSLFGDYSAASGIYENCSVVRTVPGQSSSSQIGFSMNAKGVNAPARLVYSNCSVRSTAAQIMNADGTPYPEAFRIRGNISQLDIVNPHIEFGQVAHVFTASNQVATGNGIVVNANGRSSRIGIRGVRYGVQGTMDQGGFTGCSFKPVAVSVNSAADAALDIQGVNLDMHLPTTTGVDISPTQVSLLSNASEAETYASSVLTKDYIFDLGVVTNYTTNASKWKVATGVGPDPTSHMAAWWIWSSGAPDKTTGIIGQLRDAGMFVGSTPGTTLTNHRAGVVLKRISTPNQWTASSTRLVAYADFATQTLRIDKVIAGTVTNLANIALNTHIAASTAYGVRAYIRGNVITADYFTSATPPALSASGDTTLAFTLVGSDIALFGDKVLGGVGIDWLPADAAATLSNQTLTLMHVVRGRVVNCDVVDATGTNNPVGINIGAAQNCMRTPSNTTLRIRDCDLSPLSVAGGTPVDIQYAFAGNSQYVQVTGTTGLSGPIGAAIPATYIVTATNAAWPIPYGATQLEITAVGGGGGGGGAGSAAAAQLQTGGGGGAAGGMETQMVPVGANTTLSVTIGGGGAGGGGGALGGNTGVIGTLGTATSVTGTGISVIGLGGSAGQPSTASSTGIATGSLMGSLVTNLTPANGVTSTTGQSVGGGSPSLASGGPPVGYSGGGGAGGGTASATNGGLGGGAGSLTQGGDRNAQGTGKAGTSAGANGSNAAANTGAGGGGGGGGAAGTGAGGSGGTGGSGFVVIKVLG
jgi:hypothetical protein